MRKLLPVTAVLLSASVFLSNCASIVSKSAYPVSIETNPAGAQISITDKKGKEIYKGKAPTAVRLKSGAGFFSRAEYQVRISAKGYDERVIPVTFKLNGWYFGNFLLPGGLIGLLIVDPASGAMWRIDKTTADINMVLTKSTASITEPTLKVIEIKDVSESMKASLVRVQ